MNVSCYMILHYGADYLPYAIQSVYNSVDEINIIYTPHPSHGHRVDVKPIETEELLFERAFKYDPEDKIHWFKTEKFWQEGDHRDYALSLCNYDTVLVLDYDEVWHRDVLEKALNHVYTENKARDWLINFTHIWKTFDFCCKDQGWPVRIIDKRHRDGIEYVTKDFGPIFHFGYAIENEVMRYKWSCHGHKNELRPNWFEEKYENWTEDIDDVHPTNSKGWWNPERFYKEELPLVMRNHPKF